MVFITILFGPYQPRLKNAFGCFDVKSFALGEGVATTFLQDDVHGATGFSGARDISGYYFYYKEITQQINHYFIQQKLTIPYHYHVFQSKYIMYMQRARNSRVKVCVYPIIANNDDQPLRSHDFRHSRSQIQHMYVLSMFKIQNLVVYRATTFDRKLRE